MTVYSLSILTPQGEAFNGKVSAVLASGQMGQVGILANHAPMTLALKRGVFKITTTDQGQKYFVLESGILEVKPNHDVLALVDDARSASSEQDAQQQLKSNTRT
ncbi:MAG: ATP synthase F1 subunit epsilon [Candidatus Omnitrophica bacterium]|nr:ATP synthase F1 subunit epsilon [Candidatus Omnitrophota bacterium]